MLIIQIVNQSLHLGLKSKRMIFLSFVSVLCRPNCYSRVFLLKAGEATTVLIRRSSHRNIRYYSPLRPHYELSRNKSRVSQTATDEPDKLFPVDFSLLVFTKLRFPVFARSFHAFPLRIFVCRLIKCVSVRSLWRSAQCIPSSWENGYGKTKLIDLDRLQSLLDDTQCRKFLWRKFSTL